MDIKQKIDFLKKRSIELATLALTLVPVQSNLSASNFGRNPDGSPKASSLSEKMLQTFSEIKDQGITLNMQDFKHLLEKNPNIEFSPELLDSIQPGASQKKVHALFSKGFSFTVTNSEGVRKKARCSLHQTPKGYCYGAIKDLLYKVYHEPKSDFLSAHMEKDKLLESPHFMSMPIDLSQIEQCPINTVVVIPQCKGHEHGHIMMVVDKGVYCSDGKELAGEYFNNNYKDAKGIYAFIPVDSSITLSSELLQKSPEMSTALFAALVEKDIQPLSIEKQQKTAHFLALANTQRNNDFNR